MHKLCDEAEAIWDRLQDDREFFDYVGADFDAVFLSLKRLRNQASTFLEWGSGLGVVTIMASRLGFDAYGIETEPTLVERSRQLAEVYGPEAQFVAGNFIPNQFEWNPRKGDIADRTTFEGGDAYGEMDMELRDFDLVYAYPWPEEHTLYRNIMAEFGGRNSLFLTYDIYDGVVLTRCGVDSTPNDPAI